jgi:hypothetical protein
LISAASSAQLAGGLDALNAVPLRLDGLPFTVLNTTLYEELGP